jgi:hypothetical protein
MARSADGKAARLVFNMNELPLPFPTSRTSRGPTLFVTGVDAIVQYDYHRDDGSIQWTQVAFHDAIACQFRAELYCTADDLDAYDQLIAFSDSPWLQDLHSRYLENGEDTLAGGRELAYQHWRITLTMPVAST